MQLFDTLPPHIEDALRASIERFGVLVPIVVTQHGEILDGHHRKRIANDLGVECKASVVEVADEDEAKAIAVTLNADRRQLEPEQRREVVAHLREKGHSYRAIGEALGVDKRTVQRDTESGGAGAPPAPETVRGTDGKQYPATRPVKVTDRESTSTTYETEPSATDDTPPVDLDALPGAEDRSYVRAYLKALSQALAPTRFDDHERLGPLLSTAEAEQVEIVADGLRRHADAIRRARSGLRAIEGGRP